MIHYACDCCLERHNLTKRDERERNKDCCFCGLTQKVCAAPTWLVEGGADEYAKCPAARSVA